jgi:hypothetical protein
MKRSAVLFAASLAANAAFFVAFSFRPALTPPAVRDFIAHRSVHPTASPSTVPSPASRLPFPASLWSQFDSADLPTLIARLRTAGFPDHAIRGALQALLNERHEARLDALHRQHDRPYWKAADLAVDTALRREQRKLEAERSRLDREILGPLKFDDAYYAARRRDYGELPASKIDQLDRLNADYNDLEFDARVGANSIVLPDDREKLAFLDREKRKDLAALLSPEELAEYDVRTSPIISRLSSTFGVFRATEEEFRSILDIHRSLENALYPYSRLPPSSAEDRDARANAQAAAQAEMDSRLRATLGDQRYAEFARAQSSDYQRLTALVARTDLPPQAAIDAYNLRDRLSQESNRIFDDPTLDVSQKRAALQALAQTTRAQLASTLGPTAGESYLKTASWLAEVERGGAVTFHPGGGRRLRGLPAPR